MYSPRHKDKMAPFLGLEKHGLDARFAFPQNKKTVYQNTKQREVLGRVIKENPQKALATAGLLIAKIRRRERV